MNEFTLGHIFDLSEKSRQLNIYTFSSFLTMDEQSTVVQHKKELSDYTFFGGADGCERKMIRFGNEEDFGYTENFPIATLEIIPNSKKFSEKLSHRDILGSVMGLNIKREHIGDIIINDDGYFMFATDTVSDYICENLILVKHTCVLCRKCKLGDMQIKIDTEEKILTVSSLRIDCVIGAAYNFSRSKTNELINAKKLFINSVQCTDSSKQLKSGDVISLRGYGKFIFNNELFVTKKGKKKISISVYK